MDTRDIPDSVTMKKAEEIGIEGLGSFLIQNLKTDQGWTQTCGRRAQRQGEAQYQGLVCVRQEERASSTGTCQSHVAPVLMIYRTSYIKSLDFTWSLLELLNGKDKRKAFQEVCGKFRPVMHHFFLERFLQPADWFEKRLAYTRSVAASSMVGYIVGLGDRHAMNILIDQTTAEVVHIDLGVAFEQGLMLKTPERVPFRLTRDIIDGMGVTGIEGVYRRCCEETLSVMRTNKEALLTIVEVFIHDPLYKWALSPLKALQRQKETDYELETSLEDSQDEYEGNKDAARALMRVKQKLDGYEEGEMRSIHGQVQQLVQDAIDPERLCQLFPGWGAWL